MGGDEMNRFVLLCSISLCFALNSASTLGVAESEDPPEVKIGSSSAEFRSPGTPIGIEVDELGTNQADQNEKRLEFAISPIPVVNPTVGNGVGGMGMVAFRLRREDDRSPPSVLGGGGFATDNGSWLVAAGGKFHISGDRLRVLGGAATGRFNYEFFGVGSESDEDRLAIPLTQEVSGFLIESKVRFFGNWFAGPRYLWSKSTIGIDWEKLEIDLPPDLPEADFLLQTAALGFKVERDTRDNHFYPLKGSLFEIKTDFYSPKFGSDRTYSVFDLSFSGFAGFMDKNVVAYRVALCGSSEDAPFFSVCPLGRSTDLRGYQLGEFRDYRMLVGQVEYRRDLIWRLGAVGFFGLGSVAETLGDLGSSDVKPGGGVGLRFLLAEQNRINLRFDYAWGQDSSAFYIGLGEAF